MKLTKIVAIGLAALVVSAGAVAAMPGNAPADAGNDEASADTHAQNETDSANRSDGNATANESEHGPAAPAADGNASDRRGPPTDMPAPVPDHVTKIHSLIQEFLDGALEGPLGPHVSDVANGEEKQSGDETSGNETASGNETSTQTPTPTATPTSGNETAA